MNSIGLGLKKRDFGKEKENGDTKPPVVQLNINIWDMHPSGYNLKHHIYIDFGIKASFLYDKIRLFLPFELGGSENACENITDLSSIIADENILCALFNDPCNRSSEPNSCFSKITKYDKDSKEIDKSPKDFYLYQLSEQNISGETVGFNKKKKDATGEVKGTWIDISIVDLPKDLKQKVKPDDITPEGEEILTKTSFYIRFRVEVKKPKEFIITRSLSNDLIQAAFSRIELFDLRINETHQINKKVAEKITNDDYEFARFEKANIFYVASSKVEVKNGSAIKTDSRIIESSIWQSYEPTHFPDRVFIAHHWCIKPKRKPIFQSKENPYDFSKMLEGESSVNLFFSCVYPKFQFCTLIPYLFLIVLLGAAGSYLADIIISIPPDNQTDSIAYWKLWVLVGMLMWILVRPLLRLRFKGRIWFKES